MFLWADNVTKITGNHAFKAGISIERSGMNDRIQLSFAQAPATTNQNGSFRFTDPRTGSGATTGYSVSNALLGLFDDYTEFGNKPNTKWLAMAYDFYAQDSWKPTRDLTLELGLRYSLWQPWGVRNGAMASFQPEFYDPATAPVIDRAGGFVVSGDRYNGVTLPGDEPTDDALAEFPQLAGLQRLYHGVPNGFAETAKDGFQPRLGMAYALNETDHVQGRRRKVPESRADQHHRGLRVQRTAVRDADGDQRQRGHAGRRVHPELPARRCVAIARTSPTRRRGRGTPQSIACCRGSCAEPCRTSGARPRTSSARATSTSCRPGTIQRNPGVNTNALRPYLGFGSITLYETTGRSRYNSLQTQVERRGTRGVGFSVAYTFSRTRDDASGRGDILPNAYDDSGFYGISDLDRPHVLVSQVRYDFPTLESSAAPLRWVFGNWNVSGIFQAQSGAPFSVTTTVDVAGVGPGSGPQFYEQVGDPMAVRTDWDSTLARATWFDRTAFRIPTTGTYATSQEKNSLQQPGFWDINMSLRKGFVFGAQRFDLRLEAFNILNRTRLGNAVTNPTLPDFGYITSRVGNRTMQIGMQYIF